MNATQALNRLRKVWGKSAAIQDRRTASSPEIREAARVAWRAAKDAKDAADQAVAARRNEVLAADAEYQRLKVEYQKAKEALERAPWPHHYRYTGGTAGSMFFSVKAEADNLAELVSLAEAAKSSDGVVRSA